jgi:hypothetical protein
MPPVLEPPQFTSLVETCPEPALGDATVVATTDDVNRTPSPTSTGGRLKRFTRRITKPRQPSLLELLDVTADGRRTPPVLPKRSRQIVVQSISHVPASKRDEYLVLKRLRLTSGIASPLNSALKAYDEVFGGDPDNMQALCELFPPDDDVGPRKQRHRRSIART